MLTVAVLASGNGSNLVAIHNAIRTNQLDARISLVLSNNSHSGALQFARDNDIKAIHLSSKSVPDETLFAEMMLTQLSDASTDFIALAGYMKLLPNQIVKAYKNRITNIHPALLPKFGGEGMFGMHVHRAVIEQGEKISGATVHMVDELYDNGFIVMQKQIPVLPDDDPESLARRVLEVEHEIYPKALQLFAENRVIIADNRLTIAPS